MGQCSLFSYQTSTLPNVQISKCLIMLAYSDFVTRSTGGAASSVFRCTLRGSHKSERSEDKERGQKEDA